MPASAASPSALRRGPVDEEACRRGGSVSTKDSAAKARAVRVARTANQRAYERELAARPVPRGFDSLAEFLETVGEFVRAEFGRTRELAAAVGLNDSTLAKYFRGKKRPSAQKMVAIDGWYRAKLKAPGVVRPPLRVPAPPQAGARTRGGLEPRSMGLTKLPPAIAQRLRQTAALRNVSPIVLAAQILDRHLPRD